MDIYLGSPGLSGEHLPLDLLGAFASVTFLSDDVSAVVEPHLPDTHDRFVVPVDEIQHASERFEVGLDGMHADGRMEA